jgi:uncharacterized protein (DUF433 family)
MTVWNLVAKIIVREVPPEEIARRYDVPLEAVREALDYYYTNRPWIDEEVNAEGRRLGLK